MSDCVLDPTTLALVSLAANIAANHPKKGLCQLERLQSYGVPAEKIDQVVDIARHLRDEAGQMLDQQFDAAFTPVQQVKKQVSLDLAPTGDDCGCSTTAKGNSCC